MVWISKTHRLNCQISVCWKSSATTHEQMSAFLHYSQESSFFILSCTFWSCWAICNTDTCLHTRSKRLMISLLVSKIYWISLLVCKTIKTCEQYCKQQLINIILVINWLVLAPVSMYIFVNANIVWESWSVCWFQRFTELALLYAKPSKIVSNTANNSS